MQYFSAISEIGRLNPEGPNGRPENRDELLDLRGAARLEPNQIRWIVDWTRSACDRGIQPVIVCDTNAVRLVLRTLRVAEVATICSSEEYETVCGAGVWARPVSLAHPEQKNYRSVRELFRSLLLSGVLVMSLAVSGCKTGIFIGTGSISALPAAADKIEDR